MIETHRRGFVRAVALGASAAGLAAAPGLRADDEPKKDEPRTKPQEEPEPEPKPEVEARMQLILARFGALLDGDAQAAVRAEVEGVVWLAENLRAIELSNGDGPYPAFVPYRAPLA